MFFRLFFLRVILVAMVAVVVAVPGQAADPVVATINFKASPEIEGGQEIAAAITDAFDAILYNHPSVIWIRASYLASTEGHGRMAHDFSPETEEGMARLRHWGIEWMLTGRLKFGSRGFLEIHLTDPSGKTDPWIAKHKVMEPKDVAEAIRYLARKLFAKIEIQLSDNDRHFVDRRWFQAFEAMRAYGTGMLLYRGGQDKNVARSYYQEAADLEPEVSDAFNYIGWADYPIDKAAAYKAFSQAVLIEPTFFDARWGLFRTLERVSPGKRVQQLRQIQKTHADHVDVSLHTLEEAVREKDWTTAQTVLRQRREKFGNGNYLAGVLAYRFAWFTCKKSMDEICLTAKKDRLEKMGVLYGNDHPKLATPLNNLAERYRIQGNYAEAEPLYRHSLAIREKNLGREHPRVATVLNNLAALFFAQGRYAEAEPLYQRSIAIKEKSRGPEHTSVAYSLNNLGILYEVQGRFDEAIPLYKRSLAIFEKQLGSDHPKLAVPLNSLAVLYNNQGRYAEAEPLYRRSLAIREETLGVEHPEVANSLNNMATFYEELGRYAEAEQFFKRSLAIKERTLGPQHPSVALGLTNLARLYDAQERHSDAGPFYKRALSITFRTSSPELKWLVLSSFGKSLYKQNSTEAAIVMAKMAINTIQGLRGNLSSSHHDAQKLFLEDKNFVYRDLADWLIELGRLPEAQQVLAMLKEEEYFDFIQRSSTNGDVGETRADLTPTEQAAEDKLSKPSDELARLGKRLAELRTKDESGQLSEAESAEMDRLQDALVEAEETFLAALDELTTVFAKAGRETEVASKNLGDLTALQDTLRELGHGAVLIHAFMMPDKVRLLLTTSEVQLSRDAAIKEGDLNKMIHTFRQTLKNPRQDPRPEAQALYDLIIKPLAKDLEATGAKTLMLSLDGALRYIPMAALHDGKGYLGERYALALFTEAAKDKLKDKPKSQWKLSGFGVTKAHGNLNPLPAVATELNGLVGEGGVLPGKALLDETFTAKALQRSLRHGSPVVHLASHFVFKPGTVADSFLLLGDGSHLSLQTLGSAKFRFRGVDLLTLSACETAVGGGGRKANGREIEGFGILAQRQGAKGVMATLWPVADQSTGEFMKQFYRIRQTTPGITKAEALRQAQLIFLNGKQAPTLMASADMADRGFKSAAANDNGPKTYTPPKGAPFAHPYYWAPFILMGNWL